MPVMDGPTAARAIRAAETETGAPRTPILALTANAMAHHEAEYLAAGMDGLVAKPIQIDHLITAMERALTSTPSAAAARAANANRSMNAQSSPTSRAAAASDDSSADRPASRAV